MISGTVNVENSKAWYNYNPPKRGESTPHFDITKYVYVLKTAKGDKYVKIQLTSYTKSDQPDKSGFITFTYDFLTEKEAAKPVEKVALDFSGNEVKEVQLNALTGWKYFSLKEGKEVTPAKPEEDLTWDIAFNSYYVRLNGGTSGKGKAEAVKVEGTNFAEIVEAPKAGFAKDAQGKISQGNYPNITKVDASFSQYMSGGLGTKTGIIGLNPLKAPNVFFPTNYIYIVKAADGTYAKIQVTDFYKEIAGQKVPNFPKLKYQLSKTVSQ